MIGRLEGNGAARILKMMEEQGRNVDMRTHIATVKSISPFSIRIPGDSFDIEEDLLYIDQSILPHERSIDIEGTATFNGVTGAFKGTNMIVNFKEGYIKVGDSVWVLEVNDGQKYHVIDKVVG